MAVRVKLQLAPPMPSLTRREDDFRRPPLLDRVLDTARPRRAERKTLPVYVGGFVTSRTIDGGPLAAASAVAIVPIALLTLFVQRWLVRGLSLGAVKE